MKLKYLNPLMNQIETILQEKGKVIVAIDGYAASGKTTAAKSLSEYYQGNVVHMDDFFLPFELRTEERMAEPGGNIHFERLLEQICVPLKEGKAFQYVPFDCGTGTYKEGVVVEPKAVTIFEGAYCMYPGRFPYDVSAFFWCRDEVQYGRVLKRNGPEKLKVFQNRFIPMEHKYFNAFQIPESAEFSFDTSELF